MTDIPLDAYPPPGDLPVVGVVHPDLNAEPFDLVCPALDNNAVSGVVHDQNGEVVQDRRPKPKEGPAVLSAGDPGNYPNQPDSVYDEIDLSFADPSTIQPSPPLTEIPTYPPGWTA